MRRVHGASKEGAMDYETWAADYLDLVRTVLQSQNTAMATLRLAYRRLGNEHAALAVERARECVSEAVFSLRVCDAEPRR
jgi:hypothetical protein